MRAFTHDDGSPKTHKRRNCKQCRENIDSRCLLPFRHLVQVRKYKALLSKPVDNAKINKLLLKFKK